MLKKREETVERRRGEGSRVLRKKKRLAKKKGEEGEQRAGGFRFLSVSFLWFLFCFGYFMF